MNTRDFQLQTAIAALRYEFTDFTFDHFIEHFSALRRIPLLIMQHSFDFGIYAFWLPFARFDLLVVNSRLNQMHQQHCILHEIAHLHLKHDKIPLRPVLGEELSAEMRITTQMGYGYGACFSALVNQKQEEEAERFAYFFRRKIAAARRLHELNTPTSIPELAVTANGLDFTP